MKNKSILTMLAILFLASCSSQNSTNDSSQNIDTSSSSSTDTINTSSVSSISKENLNKNIQASTSIK
jgi:uncharacterized lipoprotein YajG